MSGRRAGRSKGHKRATIPNSHSTDQVMAAGLLGKSSSELRHFKTDLHVCHVVHEDEAQRIKNGEIATMLHKDMIYHRNRTAEFNKGWKGALFLASVALAAVSMVRAAEKAGAGNAEWVERSITSANALLIGAGVKGVDEQGNAAWLRPSNVMALALSLYQLLRWWTSRRKGEVVDFPVAVILLVVAIAAVASMNSTLRQADRAYQASGALAQKVATRAKNN